MKTPPSMLTPLSSLPAPLPLPLHLPVTTFLMEVGDRIAKHWDIWEDIEHPQRVRQTPCNRLLDLETSSHQPMRVLGAAALVPMQ